ncbi:hypothetical protein DRP04_07040 [Archaeoglobales archaeon]|nr:MAG: hypothetical protein DRP04_07040 [Archaeoglobales archaeon]
MGKRNVKLVSMPPEYKHKIKQGAKTLGISESEFIRRAIDEYLVKLGLPVIPSLDNQDHLERSSVLKV